MVFVLGRMLAASIGRGLALGEIIQKYGFDETAPRGGRAGAWTLASCLTIETIVCGSRAARGQQIGLQQLTTGLGSITSITHAGDSRLFLTIQNGQIRIWSSGALLPAPFLDVSSLISCCGEQGLLSVAFHPQYASNGFLYIYTTNTAGNVEISRYQRSGSNANAADPTTRAVLLTIPHPINTNHNGGQLQFGLNGYLYIGTGDGGSGNDPPCNAQNDDSPLGKMLRIDVNQNVNTPPFYGVPSSNPMAGQPFPRNLTWAKGLRNPFRFSFDRSTGDLWIGDVGEAAREEVDFQPHTSAGGENYGWKIMEGTACGGGGNTNCPTNPAPPPCNSPLFTYPTYEYSHGTGECVVIGGYVYRGTRDPALAGSYLYGDLCTGHLWVGTQLQTPTLPGLQTFGEGVDGELYAGTGDALYLITHPCAIRGDFNADGATDILWRNTGGADLVWLMNGTTVASGVSLPSADPSWTIVGTVDFNCSGQTDILWQSTGGGVLIWLMNGTTVTSGVSLPSTDPSWTIVGARDFNGDGQTDILWRHTSGSVLVWLMNGTTVTSGVSLPSADPNWSIVGTGDFNGDGKPDILWRHISGAVLVWLMNGTTVTSSISLPPADPSWSIVGTGDFNGDGRPDILWRHISGAVLLWLMNGTTVTSSVSLPPADPSWSIVGTRDFNGDGRPDILWRHISGAVLVWLMNGTTVTSGVSLPAADPSWSIVGPK